MKVQVLGNRIPCEYFITVGEQVNLQPVLKDYLSKQVHMMLH